MNNALEFSPRVPGSPRRGEVYQWSDRHVVVISNDIHNSQLDPMVLTISRRLRGSSYAIELEDADPFGGRVVLYPVMTVPASELTGPLGMLTGVTLNRVRSALNALVTDD